MHRQYAEVLQECPLCGGFLAEFAENRENFQAHPVTEGKEKVNCHVLSIFITKGESAKLWEIHRKNL